VREDLLRPARPRLLPLRRGSETILLIEDEPGVRKLARTVLQSQGYKVLEAQNGSEALLLSDRPGETLHMLLTDVVMTGLSGPEVASALRQQRTALKDLYMSGYTNDAALRDRVSQAASAFLPKPFTPQELASKVRAVLDEPPSRAG
jgi:CheY-like chemotaxis protein